MNRIRVMLLLAWRDAVRHKGRSLLIVALVALPVLVIGAADVLFRSTQTTPQVRAAGELAGSSAYLWAPVGAAPIQQGPTDAWPVQFVAVPKPDRPAATVTFEGAPGDPATIDLSRTPIREPAEVLGLLPTDSVITRWDHGMAPISANGARYQRAVADLLDLASPAAGNRYRVVAGVAATEPGSLTLTRALADELGVAVGDTISMGAPARDYQLVGIVEATVHGSKPVLAAVGPAGSVAGVASQWNGARYLVSSPVPITWNMVQQLNARGIQVYSRAVVLNQPYQPPAEFDSTAALGIAAAAMLVVLGLTQVVFLSGPAFAIAARRMRRQLGLAAATGAAPGHVAGVVIGSGVLLGVIGAVVGTAIGALLGVWIQPLLTSWTGIDFPAVTVRFGELALIAAIGAVTSVLAAAWPAVTALRTDPIAALARRAKPPKRPGIISLIGLIVAGIGVVVLVWAASRSIPTDLPPDQRRSATGERSIWIGGGLVAIQLGLIVGTPQLIALFARLGRILPTAPRMALRTTARHRGRSTGAVATILVASTGAVLAAVLINTMSAQQQADYEPALRHGLVSAVTYSPTSDGTVSATARAERGRTMAAMLDRLWPGAPAGSFARLVAATGRDSIELQPAIAAAQRCPWFSPSGGFAMRPGQQIAQPSGAELESARTDPRCAGSTFSTLTAEQGHIATGMGQSGLPEIVVGDAHFRRILTGVDDPVADAALAAGKVVVLDRRSISDGLFAVDRWEYHPDREPTIARGPAVPAVLGKWAPSPIVAIVPPAAVDALDAAIGAPGFVAEPASLDSTAANTLSATGAAVGLDLNGYIETGSLPWAGEMPSVWLILWIAAALIIGVVLVVTALGVVDADDDSATFAAVGASARLRRTLSGWSALTTTGVGCLLGAGAGILVAWGVYRLLQNVNGGGIGMLVPWPQIAILVIALPTIAFGLAAVFTRSKTQLIRRAE